MNYSKEIKDKATGLFGKSFNNLNFGLLKAGVGEDKIYEYIQCPSDECLDSEVYQNYSGDKKWDSLTKEEKSEVISDFYLESEHYPMWNTIFEATDDFISDKIMEDIDGLYKLGIGVIAPTDFTGACLFIAGAGYNFYDAHWIPLFIHWEWIDEKEKKRPKLVNWNEFGNTLERLAKNNNETIKRHAKGLLTALKL